jgi:hypothetical protein
LTTKEAADAEGLRQKAAPRNAETEVLEQRDTRDREP